MHLTLPLNHLGAGMTLSSTNYFINVFYLSEHCSKDKIVLMQGNYTTCQQKKHIAVRIHRFLQCITTCRKKNISKTHKKKRQPSVWNQFMGLKEQSLLIEEILDICQPKTILQWQKVIQHLPSNIFSFCSRYLIVELTAFMSPMSQCV